MSDKIKAHHLERKAILYIRQSSSYQVTHNEESRRLQYAMQNRLKDLGWRDVDIVDEDLGRSAAGNVTRAGFERMVSDVCLGKVGAVAAREVSRFARNSREWQQLVEVCRLVDTLLIDQDVIYAPRQSNDRLLLGLKGSLNEYELDLLRQRSLEARYEKARRGELVVAAPVGYLKTEDQRLEKDPDRRVQERILLVFRKFMELGSIRQTLFWFIEEELKVPARGVDGALSWKRPRYNSIQGILTHPIYAGAYVYGRTEHGTHCEGGRTRKVSRRRPQNKWLALIPEHHEAYLDWKQFEQIQKMIAANCLGEDRPGAAKRGPALLAGLLRCRRCGRKLTVSYTGGKARASHPGGRYLRYACIRGYLDNGEPKCISFGGIPVDGIIGREVLAVVQPGALAAAVEASQEMSSQQDVTLKALERDLEAARYAADRAQRQYDGADPGNRLVVDELENRWNAALEHMRELELRIEQHRAARDSSPAASLEEFTGLADELEAVWNAPQSDTRLKKRIVRALIHEVIVDVDGKTNEVILVIHWQGGVHTELRLPRRRRGGTTQTATNIIEAVRILTCVSTDRTIACFLNRNKMKTGRGNRWTKELIASLRSYHHIPRHCPETKKREGWLTLTEASRWLQVSSRTLRLATERGDIPGQHPLADGPWVFHLAQLQKPTVQEFVQNLKQRRGKAHPAVPHPGQRTLDFSGT
jgi:DNA invertase Pin-like site-specific DNA recombinase